ncbi:alpha/beta fold hydrolase, partial [Clostridium botulinum]|nr:alpha/beta fold hydrolase [Clostridium botulinum]
MNLRRKIKYKSLTIIKVIFFIIAIFLLLQCFKPTWTPKIKGKNSISELHKVHINGTELEVMIRGSGKSYNIGTDYSNVCADTHVEDLIELTKYIEEYLGQEKSILIGHSYGTYIATMASNQQPELYHAYIGIGQVSDMVQSELYGLDKCIDAAKIAKDTDDLKYLESIENDIKQ